MELTFGSQAGCLFLGYEEFVSLWKAIENKNLGPNKINEIENCVKKCLIQPGKI